MLPYKLQEVWLHRHCILADISIEAFHLQLILGIDAQLMYLQKLYLPP